MIDKEKSNEPLIDSLRLRAALLLACIELTGGEDMHEAWELAEQFYDAAPELLAKLEEGTDDLPKPGKVLFFPSEAMNKN